MKVGPSRAIAFVVDDEGVIASTIELILISKGFEARSFVDPHDALEAARLDSPHLLLTDVVMPRMNGIELAIQIRQLHPSCAVLLSSGQTETAGLLEDAIRAGYEFPIVAKPIHPDALMAKIEELLASPL